MIQRPNNIDNGGSRSSTRTGSNTPPSGSSFSYGLGQGPYHHMGHSFHGADVWPADSQMVPFPSKVSASAGATKLIQPVPSWVPKLHFLGRLGSGGCAVVDEVGITGYTQTLALKTFRSSFTASPREWRREVEIMSRLKEHPHIIKLVQLYLKKDSSAFLIQPVADYDLGKFFGSYSATPKEQEKVWLWFSCLASGLEHIHRHGVLHRDIKPDNILIEGKNVLFADFGSSSIVDKTRSLQVRAFHHTKIYAAPEIRRNTISTASDVFSLGCVFLEMVTILMSPEKWKKLRRRQDEFHSQTLPSKHWALEWIHELSPPSHQILPLNRFDTMLTLCSQMTDFERDKRPNATDLCAQVNLQLHPQCNFTMTLTHRFHGAWSRKRPTQEYQREMPERPAKLHVLQAPDEMNDTTKCSKVTTPGASSATSRLRKPLDRKRQRLRTGFRKLTKVHNTKETASPPDAAASLNGNADSKHVEPTTSMNMVSGKSRDRYAYRLGTKTWDKFRDYKVALEDVIEDVRMFGRFKDNPKKGMQRRNSTGSSQDERTGPSPPPPTLGPAMTKAKSVPGSHDKIKAMKTWDHEFWNSRGYHQFSQTYRTKDIGPQPHKSFWPH